MPAEPNNISTREIKFKPKKIDKPLRVASELTRRKLAYRSYDPEGDCDIYGDDEYQISTDSAMYRN